MVDSPNLFDPKFDEEQQQDGFRNRRARLGAQAGSERLGASLYELPPRQAPFPLHYHLGNEELLVVVRGRPILRTDVSEMNSPDIVIRPESGKLSAFRRPPGSRGEGMHGVFFERDSAPFWEGEDPPPAKD